MSKPAISEPTTGEPKISEPATITATFGAARGDRAALSASSRTTLETFYQHPISHNLNWADAIALFSHLGSVAHKTGNEVVFAIGGEHHLMRKAHGKDLTADEVVVLRHLLTRAGWGQEQAAPRL